jgi:hypothetical protein
MAKYTIEITLSKHTIRFDTDDYEDFAKTKDDLADNLDPTDPDVVHDWVMDNWQDHELIDIYDVDVESVIVKPKE